MSGRFVIVSEAVGKFLEGKAYSTSKEKIAFMAALYGAERNADNPLVLNEADYDSIIRIVNGEKYVVDNGRRVVHVGKPIGKEEYLCAIDEIYDEEGNRTIDWGLDTLEHAYVFSSDEINTLVPEAFRNENFLVLEGAPQLEESEDSEKSEEVPIEQPTGQSNEEVYLDIFEKV